MYNQSGDIMELFSQSAIKIEDKLIMYFDPFNIPGDYHDADIIFITHSHYDHFSPVDIEKVKNSNTTLVITRDLVGLVSGNTLVVEQNKEYTVKGIHFKTIPAYNINKEYHKKSNGWVGYIIYASKTYYIAGDTDITDESKQVKCDIAFLPIGGTYTMDYKEASTLASIINTKIVVPTHYSTIVGTKEDAIKFKELNKIETLILMEDKK